MQKWKCASLYLESNPPDTKKSVDIFVVFFTRFMAQEDAFWWSYWITNSILLFLFCQLWFLWCTTHRKKIHQRNNKDGYSSALQISYQIASSSFRLWHTITSRKEKNKLVILRTSSPIAQKIMGIFSPCFFFQSIRQRCLQSICTDIFKKKFILAFMATALIFYVVVQDALRDENRSI